MLGLFYLVYAKRKRDILQLEALTLGNSLCGTESFGHGSVTRFEGNLVYIKKPSHLALKKSKKKKLNF